MKKASIVLALVLGAVVCSSCSQMQKPGNGNGGGGQWSDFEEAVPMANAGA